MTPTQTVETLYEAFGRGDVPAMPALMHPELEWTFEADPARVLFGGSYRGPQGFLRFLGRLGATVEPQGIELLELREDGDSVTVRARETLRSLHTGKSGEFEMHQEFTVEDGLIRRFRERTDVEALADLLGADTNTGLPEQCFPNAGVRAFDQIPGLEHRTLAGNGPHPGSLQGLEVWHQTLQPGCAVPPHRHDCEEVVVLLRGRMLCIVEGVQQEVGPASTIVVPRNRWHVLETLGDETCELIGVLNMAPVDARLPGDVPLALPWDAIPAAEAEAAGRATG